MAKVEPEKTAGESAAARITEPAPEGTLRVLMLRDITTKPEQVEAVKLEARSAGFDEPVILNVDEVHVEGVLEALGAASEAGEPFHILVESIWRRSGLPERAKAQQPGLLSIAVIYYASERDWFASRNPAVDNVVSRNENMAAQMGAAFQSAREAVLHPRPATAAV